MIDTKIEIRTTGTDCTKEEVTDYVLAASGEALDVG